MRSLLILSILTIVVSVTTPCSAQQGGLQNEPTGFWVMLLDRNPGFATIVVSSVLLPIIIMIINNRHNRKMKEVETRASVEIESEKNKLHIDFDARTTKRNHENTVHASLVKILFEVQRLHVQLSGICVDYKCIEDAVLRFQEAFDKYQSVISDNQLSLSATVTDHLYAFYRSLSGLLIDLRELREANAVDAAIVSVYEHSQELADEVIQIQTMILTERKELEDALPYEQMENMRNCCGRRPSAEQLAKYGAFKNRAVLSDQSARQTPKEPTK